LKKKKHFFFIEKVRYQVEKTRGKTSKKEKPLPKGFLGNPKKPMGKRGAFSKNWKKTCLERGKISCRKPTKNVIFGKTGAGVYV
jgi:hypothetical protein